MSEDRPLPNKLDVARALMLKGSVFIHLDPRVEEVSVPPWLRNQPQLVLQVGLEMALPIRDLVVDEQGVQATLSFNRSPFLCVVPWASVFALVGDDGRGLVWPESMPVEIAAEVDREAQRRGPRAGSQGEAEAGKGDEGGRVERIVGRAVRPSGDEPKRPRALRSAKKVSRLGKSSEATVSRLERFEPKPPSQGGLQLIRGQSGGHTGSTGGRAGARRKKASHLRVVK